MTVNEAAKRIGISPSKLYQLVARREIAHYRLGVGGKIILADADIDAFMARCRVGTADVPPAVPSPRVVLKHLNLS